ncbi:hypothetical protein F7725_010907 [Dissostichus mawsoni]|uniref:Uncharacterized protein n=1 Tax=Dissostichus mawsoni TaxID=36200 RepID=A0A7J5Z7R9_DISMA|nr:hypothetical protein F7725_010907 [Dissostichus mawsoni]
MSTAVEAVGFIMCIISWLITGSALANDYWKISTVSGSVIISQRQFENLIVEDFNDPFTGGVKFELSTGLYMGWGGSSLSILGGALLCAACKRASPAGKKGGYYGNKPQKVYTATAKSEPDSSARAYV